MIIKTEDFGLEISTGTDVYFESKKLGQNFKKWDDLEDNEKIRLEIIQKKVARRQFSYNGHIPERRSDKEIRSGRDRRRKLRTSKY